MHQRIRNVLLAGCLGLLLAVALGGAVRPGTGLADPRLAVEVRQTLSSRGRVSVLIRLAPRPDLSPATRLSDKAARGQWVYETLRRTALETQARVVEVLAARGVPYRRFWIVNAVAATVDAETVEQLLRLPEVSRIMADTPLRLEEPEPMLAATAVLSGTTWGVERVQAPWAWAQGYTGAGVVVAGQDTGYQWDHPVLKYAFRGYDPISDTVDFDYNWHDAIHGNLGPLGVNPCGYDSTTPCDDHGHGTHTMGTIVGNDLAPGDPAWPAGASHAVGVAPGARWIGCRNMEAGWGAPSTYIECYEWLTAPYPVGGDSLRDGDPARAPDVINNSWACPPEEGCTPDKLSIIEPAVQAAEAAGIVVVSSAGNEGPACGSVQYPSAIYPAAFAVGAVDDQDRLAGFSSRGPVQYAGQTLIKPDVSAPGVGVLSGIPPNQYASWQGTSMAAPHVAGVIALLLDAEPRLKGRPGLIKAIVAQSADTITDFVCGGDVDGNPNNRFGWGVVNARRAIESLSQPGFLVGHVRDGQGQPIKGAEVVLQDGSGAEVERVSTDMTGGFSFTPAWGAYRLVAQRFSYRSAQAEPVYVVGGSTTQVDFVLEQVHVHLPLLLRANPGEVLAE
ncbi:MAG: peptidase S8 [Caldilineae bacterium]|nr:MAG: peptidase S8 [Caldilineae bacterium]